MTAAISECLAMVAPAEAAFRSRWRMSTLERLDRDLHDRVEEQRALYDSAILKGSETEARMQAEAMVRGWRAACQRMEHPLQPDDAYFVGLDLKTGTKVVIAECKQSAARAQQVEGERCVFLTPHEVAAMLGGLEVLKQSKTLFPDAEIVEVYPEAAA